MRLHSLEVTAVGPFAGTERVDFDALGADGLFLLHGPTGAGKTSVLDAVALALFGTVPGARREGRRLRSDHAADGVGPQVVLELTVGGRRVRLVRRPEWQRPKKRGAGTTKEPAQASLTWVDEPGSEGITRIDEVARVVEGLLGMSADQFFQVVLLPQGEFARFLRAGTDERATLLQRLFDTGRFASAEAWLADRRRTTAAAAEAGRREVEVLVGQVATAAGADDVPGEHVPVDGGPGEDVPGEDGPGGDATPLGWARAQRDAATAAQRAGQEALDVARAAAAAADADLAAATELAGLVARRAGARDRLAVLAASAGQRAEATRLLDAARRAAPVAAAGRDADDAAVAAQRVAAEASQVAAALARDRDGASALTGDLAVACDAWRAEVGRLAELVDLGATARTQSREAAQLGTRGAALAARLASLEADRAALPAQRDAAEEVVSAAQRASDAVPGLLRDLQQAREVRTAADSVPVLQERRTGAERVRVAAVEAHQRAKEHWLELKERRIDGIAAELAGALELDAACVVCGSTVHPAPAAPVVVAEVVTKEDEAVAHEVEQAAQADVARAVAAVAAAAGELAVAQARAGGHDPVSAAAAVAGLEAEHAEAVSLAATTQDARRTVAALAERDTHLAEQGRQLLQDVTRDGERRAALLDAVLAAESRLVTARGDDPDVAVRRDRLARLAERGGVLLTARTELAAAQREAAARAARAADLAGAAGFGSVADAVAAELEAEHAAELTGVLEQARDIEVSARAVLDEPAVAALPEDAAADVVAPRAACEQARSVADDAQAAHARAQHRSRQLAELVGTLEARSAELGPVMAEADRVAALADTVAGRGQNSRRMSLHSYVLAARLEEVAVAASVRLQRMSGGRYELVHNDAAGTHGRRGGLGLDVRDDFTGVVRPASTLSGGESFLASLSLALGLADVVAAESGGVLLDTLFIDEGFGTLDADTLDQVMTVLDELRAGGRVVGLVSHVDELRQRIPTRLHVRRTRTGSSLRIDAA